MYPMQGSNLRPTCLQVRLVRRIVLIIKRDNWTAPSEICVYRHIRNMPEVYLKHISHWPVNTNFAWRGPESTESVQHSMLGKTFSRWHFFLRKKTVIVQANCLLRQFA